jgi:hypothetical protein
MGNAENDIRAGVGLEIKALVSCGYPGIAVRHDGPLHTLIVAHVVKRWL